MSGGTKTKGDDGIERERERQGERCACSPSNCALRAVAGNERGATGGGVYSILFALPLPSLFVPFFFFFLFLFFFFSSLYPSNPRTRASLGLFTFAAFVCLSLARSFARSLCLPLALTFVLRYPAYGPAVSRLRWPAALLHL